jgi:cobalamin biosynthetic protein CobC
MTGALQHGGRLDAAIATYGGARDKWIDLSTGINPTGYPVKDVSAEAWRELPDEGVKEQLRAAMRTAYGAPDGAPISLAGGSQQHIQMLPRLFKSQDVAVVGYTYQEHAACWSRAGHSVFVTDGLESAEATARIVVVVNPNNPNGTIHDKADLLDLARRLGARGGALVVDEAFADTRPDLSVCAEAGRDGLVILRSVGKFYGLAGARVGAMLAAEALVARMHETLGPWAVSGPSLHISTEALENKAWARRMGRKLASSREKLEDILSEGGLSILGGTDLFVLARCADAAALADHLAKARILVRTFPGQSEWVRFGLPGGAAAFNRLKKALQTWSADA